MKIDYVLKTYYNGLPPYSALRDEVITIFIQALRDTEPSGITDMDTIKAFVKIGHHVLEHEPELLDGLELKLIRLGECGTRLFSHAGVIMRMRIGHLHGHLADLKWHVAQKTGDVSFLEQAYFHRLIAGSLTSADARYHMHTLTYAADIAVEILKKTGNTAWLQKAYQANISAAGIGHAVHPRHVAYAYLHAGEQAEQLAGITGNAGTWEERARSCYQNFLDYYRKHPSSHLQAQIESVEDRVRLLSGVLF